jgi:hypothetical protein
LSCMRWATVLCMCFVGFESVADTRVKMPQPMALFLDRATRQTMFTVCGSGTIDTARNLRAQEGTGGHRRA